MKINILIACIIFTFSKPTDCEPVAGLYISPRNAPSCWDMGIFRHTLYGASLKVPFKDRTYNVRVPRDSVYELYLCKVSLPAGINITGNKVIRTDSDGIARILMILNCNGKKDTIRIDHGFIMHVNGQDYQAPDELVNWIEHQMPEELNDSWKNNLPALP